MRPAGWLAALAAAVALAGCSATRFGYENADLFLRWQAKSYLDVHDAQADQLEGSIATFLSWHRARALPQYVRFAEEAGARLSRGLQREDLVWGYDSFIAQVRESVRAAAARLAPLLDALDAEQIAHLEQRLAEENRKFAKEHLQGTPEERRERRLRRNHERLEEWFGTLSEPQAARIKRYSERAPLAEELRDRDRKRLQAEFLAMVRARAAGRGLADWAAQWDRHRDPAYSAAIRAVRDEHIAMLLDLDRTLSLEQRRKATARLRGYAEDFTLLARRGGAEEPAR